MVEVAAPRQSGGLTMRITRLESQLLHVPLSRPRSSPAEAAAGRLNHVVVLLAGVETDTGLRGLGFAYALQGSGRALLACAEDDVGPLLAGEDPLDHERLGAKVYWRLQTVGRRGLVAQTWSAFDLALWDLKGKVANLPLYKLLGGARDAAPAYGADTGWLWMSPEEIAEASQPYLEQGLMGIKVKVGADPEADAERLNRLRETLGDDVWLAVDANERYDFGTALAMGRFFEEEVGADWFEEPILCEDVAGHARLKASLEIPLAAGEMLFGLDEFERYLRDEALDVVQPDVTRLGGLTATLKVIALAERHHRPVSPHLLPEVGVHLCCGLPAVTSVEYMPWLSPLWQEPPRLESGRLLPPPRPGLGLEADPAALARYRARF
jgi:L-alanine-DL-glutamate epimerase-like enolase superfamily enzyme